MKFDPDVPAVGTGTGSVDVVGWVGDTGELTTLPGVPAGSTGTGKVVVGTTTGSTGEGVVTGSGDVNGVTGSGSVVVATGSGTVTGGVGVVSPRHVGSSTGNIRRLASLRRCRCVDADVLDGPASGIRDTDRRERTAEGGSDARVGADGVGVAGGGVGGEGIYLGLGGEDEGYSAERGEKQGRARHYCCLLFWDLEVVRGGVAVKRGDEMR